MMLGVVLVKIMLYLMLAVFGGVGVMFVLIAVGLYP